MEEWYTFLKVGKYKQRENMERKRRIGKGRELMEGNGIQAKSIKTGKYGKGKENWKAKGIRARTRENIEREKGGS